MLGQGIRPGGTKGPTGNTYPQGKPRPRWQYCTRFSLMLAIFTFLFLRISRYFAILPQAPSSSSKLSSMPVITLSFDSITNAKFLNNNCFFSSKFGYRYIAYTDSLHHAHCRLCECVLFTKINCPCPRNTAGKCIFCEKLRFVIDRLEEFEEFIFLDADLIIIKPYFLDRLSLHAKESDFLLSYIQYNRNLSYYETFNTDLFFTRRIPGLDYEEMYRYMYNEKVSNDQKPVSRFIQAKYENWDALSLKWHCRHLISEAFDIPPDLCYTIHTKNEWRVVLPRINFTLKTLP